MTDDAPAPDPAIESVSEAVPDTAPVGEEVPAVSDPAAVEDAPGEVLKEVPSEPAVEDASASQPVVPEATVEASTPSPIHSEPHENTPEPYRRDVKGDSAKGLAVRRKKTEENLEKILVFARTKPSITNDMVEKLLHVSGATATRYLNMLVLRGKLRREGRTRGVQYSII